MTSRTTMWRHAAALAVAVLGGVHCPGAGAVAIELGVFAPYNLVVLGDATDLAYVEGRLAVGGTLDTLRLTVGPAVSSTESDVVAVVVKDVRRWSQGALLRGGTLAAQARINGTRGPEVTIPGIVRDEFGPVIDMAASTVNAEILSEQIRAMPPTGTATASGSTLKLTGSGARVEVFKVTAKQMLENSSLAVANVASDAYILLNVEPNEWRLLHTFMDTSVLLPWKGRVIVNARDTESILLGGLDLNAALLAPNACICNVGGARIVGTVIVRRVNTTLNVMNAPLQPLP